MTIEIPLEHQQFVKAAVESGQFESETQVVGEALRLLEERGRQTDDLRREMQVGLDDLERGDYVNCDDSSLKGLFEQIKSEGRQRGPRGE